MLVKVWWEDLRKAVTADSTQGTSEYQGAGTSLSIFALVSGNFTGFHTHTEWMSPPCPGGQGGQGGFKWLVHERSMKRGSATTCERLLCLFYTQNKKILDYQTWPTHLFAKFTKCAKVYGLSFLDFTFRMLIGWAGKLRSRGRLMIENFRRVGPDNFKMSVEAICPLALYSSR